MNQGNILQSLYQQQIQRLYILIPLLLSLGGLIDVILRCIAIGFSRGLNESVNDPGKSFYHIIILPISISILLYKFPPEILEVPRLKKVFLLFLSIFCLCTVVLTSTDFNEARTSRLLNAEDISSASYRYQLDSIRSGAENLIQHPNPQMDSEMARYRSSYQQVLSALRRGERNPIPVNLLSFRSYFSTLLTIAALLSGALYFSTYLTLVLFNNQFSSQKMLYYIDALISQFVLLMLWLVLRTFSDWHINFYEITSSGPVMTMAVVGLIFSLILLMLNRKLLNLIKYVFSFLAPVATFGIIAFPEKSSVIFHSLTMWKTGYITIIIVFILIAFAFYLYFAINPKKLLWMQNQEVQEDSEGDFDANVG